MNPYSGRIDLNCDLGEGCGHDAAIVPLISSANIACGAHAGNDQTIIETMRLCRAHGVAIGAHPGYPDRTHFGREELGLTADEIAAHVSEQLRHFLDLAREEDVRVEHIKLHGALYNRAAHDASVAAVVAASVKSIAPQLRLVSLSGSAMLDIAGSMALRTAHEVFPDRGYDAQGRLLSRRESDAVITAPDDVAQRAFLFASCGLGKDRDGQPLSLRADTLCMHGDRDDAIAVAQAVRACLERSHIRVAGLDAP